MNLNQCVFVLTMLSLFIAYNKLDMWANDIQK